MGVDSEALDMIREEHEKKTRMPWGRAVFISLPFFVLTLFWQAYDYIVPLILSRHFSLGTTIYSIIMSADNVFAMIFLPLFGILSDRINSKLGRRTPLILFGTFGGVVGLFFMARIDALAVIGNIQLAPFLAALLATVFFMSLYRSPSAALVADCFIRPQRTKANAVLNLMGAFAGVLFGLAGRRLISYQGDLPVFTGCMYFVIIMMCAIMILYVIVVRENALVNEVRQQNERLGLIDEKTDSTDRSLTKLSAGERKSLWLILITVFLVYISYNGFHTHYTNYLVTRLKQPASWTGPYLVEVVLAMLMMIPAAFITTRFGRRKSCMVGSLMCAVGYFGTSLVTPEKVNTIYIWFVIAAIGFPLFGINLGPMVLELGKDIDAGRYLGYYYVAATGAQIVAPTLASLFINRWGYGVLGIFSSFFTAIAFLVLLPVRHGDVKPSLKHAIDDAIA